MWNSNSVISWLPTGAGLDPDAIPLPPGGRAPGWDAGIAVAERHRTPFTGAMAAAPASAHAPATAYRSA